MSTTTGSADLAAYGLPNRNLTVREFCEWANCSEGTFYAYKKDGRIRVRQIGRKNIIAPIDAVAWLNSLRTS